MQIKWAGQTEKNGHHRKQMSDIFVIHTYNWLLKKHLVNDHMLPFHPLVYANACWFWPSLKRSSSLPVWQPLSILLTCAIEGKQGRRGTFSFHVRILQVLRFYDHISLLFPLVPVPVLVPVPFAIASVGRLALPPYSYVRSEQVRNAGAMRGEWRR